MPKTKFQSVIFTVMMVFCMVYCMTVYMQAVGAGGLNNGMFLTALREMWLEYVAVFLLVFFVVTHIARRLALQVVDPEVDRPILVILTIQTFTVICVVPAITLFATLVHSGLTPMWFSQWIATAALCFPAAFCLQLFLVGPLVRAVFRRLFSESGKH